MIIVVIVIITFISVICSRVPGDGTISIIIIIITIIIISSS